MKKRKIWILLMLLPISCLSFTSCMEMERVEIYQRALIQSIGVDYKDEEFIVNIQYYISSGSGGNTSIDPSKLNVVNLEAKGPTIAAAFSAAEQKEGLSIYFGHSRVLVIGEAAAREKGLASILNYFNTATFSKTNILVAIYQGEAKKLIERPALEGINPAQALEDTLILQEEDGQIINVKLFDALRDLENKNKDAVLPYIKVEPKPEEEGGGSSGGSGGDSGGEESIPVIQGLAVVGTALFKDCKMVGHLDKHASNGLTWLRGNLEKFDFTLQMEKKIVGISAYLNNSIIKINLVDDTYHFNVDLDMNIQILEIIDSDQKLKDEDLVEITRLATQYIIDLCKKSVVDGIYREKINILSSKNLRYKGSIEETKDLRDNFSEYTSRFIFDFNANSVLSKPGFELDYSVSE